MNDHFGVGGRVEDRAIRFELMPKVRTGMRAGTLGVAFVGMAPVLGLSTSIAAGAPPDIFLMNYRYYAQFAARGAIEPVTERLDVSEAFAPEDFYAVALDAEGNVVPLGTFAEPIAAAVKTTAFGFEDVHGYWREDFTRPSRSRIASAAPATSSGAGARAT